MKAIEFIHKYARALNIQPGTKEYSTFAEDVRRLSINSKLEFRELQKKGTFMDGTGDHYLEAAKESIDDPDHGLRQPNAG